MANSRLDQLQLAFNGGLPGGVGFNHFYTVFYIGSTLYSEGSVFRRFLCPKPFEVAMLRRSCGPKVLYSEVHLVWGLLCSDDSIFQKALHYMDSMLQRFFSPKVRKFYISCGHHSLNDYLSISVIRRQWVCSPRSNEGQDAHPMNRGSYFLKQRLKVCEIDL